MIFNVRDKMPAPHLALDEHTLLFAIHVIRFFSLGLIGIFIPVYIYQVTHALGWVLLFFALSSGTIALFLLTLGNFVFTHFSLKNLLGISFLLIMLKSYLLHLAESAPALFIYAAILTGLVTVTYWVPYHTIFIRKFKASTIHFGKESSQREILQKIGSALAPFIGGLVIAWYGFPTLFGLSVVLYIVAAAPVLYLTEIKPLNKHNLMSMLKKYKEKYYSRIIKGFVGEGLDAGIHTVFWPILLFIVLKDFIRLGTINSIALLLSVVSAAIAGRLVDKHGFKKLHKAGAFGLALAYVPMLITRIPGVLYATEVADKLIAPLFGTPLMSSVYEQAVKHNELDFMIFREFILHATIATLCVLLIVILGDSTNWAWVFIIGAVGVLLSTKVTE